MGDLKDLSVKLEIIKKNILEIKRLLKQVKDKSDAIPQQVFELQKETVLYAKQVSNQLQDFSIGSDINEMKIHRTILCDFLIALSDFSVIQKTIIDSARDSVDSCDNSDIDDMIAVLRPLLENDSKYIDNKSLIRNNNWIQIGLIGALIIGGITAIKYYRK